MKKLAPHTQAEALKYLYTYPGSVIAERPKPKKSARSKVVKMAWFAGSSDIEMKDATVNKMEENGWIKSCGDGKYNLDEEGKGLAEMMVNQKVFDFKTGLWMQVKSYKEDPLHKPDILGANLLPSITDDPT